MPWDKAASATSLRSRATGLLAETVATGFGVAHITPFAKATLGSAAALAGYGAAAFVAGETGGSASFNWHAGAVASTAITAWVGAWASSRIATESDPDPSRAVIDEFAGQWCAVLFLPIEWAWMLAAFILFRGLDVLKPFGIRRLENIPHKGWGIMLDDVAAGILCAAILNAAKWIAG